MGRACRGRVALVTGASRGIGRGIAQRLAAEGARVAVTARTLSSLSFIVEHGIAVRTLDGTELVPGWQPDEIDPGRLVRPYLSAFAEPATGPVGADDDSDRAHDSRYQDHVRGLPPLTGRPEVIRATPGG